MRDLMLISRIKDYENNITTSKYLIISLNLIITVTTN